MNKTVHSPQRIQTALRLEALAIAWMVVEASVSIGAGIMARSVLLLAFGVDGIIELVSACLLYWRLLREFHARPEDAAFIETIERSAARIGGYLLYTLAVYVVAQAGWGLFHRESAETSWWGIAVTVVAAAGMPFIAKAKIRIADEINSPALRADGIESLTCGNMARIALMGLVANALLHWWWLDSVAALILIPFLIKEGREAISGECSCHAHSDCGR